MGPITLVTGLPRSGTSLVAGTIRACGAWTGPTVPASEHHAKGNVENSEIRERILKPYLSRIPACPLGLRSLPVINHKPFKTGVDWRRMVTETFKRQGYEGGPVVYKDAKIALTWRLWAAAFPEAKWVIVRRPLVETVRSVCAAEPMMRHFDSESDVWRWAEMYDAHVSSIPHGRDVAPEPESLRRMLEWLGLDWPMHAQAISEWIDWGLLHGRL